MRTSISSVLLLLLLERAGAQLYTATYYRCESSAQGTRENTLIPYFSAAVPQGDRRFAFGTLVYVPGLRGARLPNGRRHRGIFRIDDVCKGSCEVSPDGGGGALGVFDVHVGSGGRLAGGAKRVRVYKHGSFAGASRKYESHARRHYGGSRC